MNILDNKIYNELYFKKSSKSNEELIINLYKRLNFNIIDETKTRYRMIFNKKY